MKEETDLRAVKALAHAMLELDIEQTRLSPFLVKHPFTDNGISGVRKPDGSLAIADLLNKPDDLALWRKQVGSVIDEADSAVQIYMMVTKSYALGFLKFARNSLSEKDFAELLADAWIRTEAPNNDPNLSKRDLLSLFKATDPTLLMDEEDYQQFQDLDDVVTVYRGVTSMNAKNVKALSWTLDRDTAEWFAHRFGENGTVYEAQIQKQHIYAYFSGRNEDEVIVDPKHLTEITQVQAMEHQAMGGLDEDKLGLFLCQDCLDEFASSCYGSENIPPIAVVSFEHRYLAALNERTPWFLRKDYLVTVNYDEDGSIGIVAVYNPPRFQDNKDTVD